MDYIKARPNKVATIPLETSAYYQPYQDLNINFYTMDINTAFLKFAVTQNNEALSIGQDNAMAQIILKHQDGSKIVDNLDVYDAMNGILTYRIPNELLARQGQVTAQAYIARRGKEVEDTSYAVVAERIFGFTISNSLIDSIDAETKLNYIVRFEELEKVIDDRIKAIEETFESVEQYVQRVEAAKAQGVSDINLAINQGLEQFNANFTEKISEIDKKKSEVIENIEDKTDSLSRSYSEVQQKISDFEVNEVNFVTKEDSSFWQKVKLTESNGDAILIDAVDFDDPEIKLTKTGFYYCTNCINQPIEQNNIAFVDFKKYGNIAQITYQAYNSDKRFIKVKVEENSWSLWQNPFKDFANANNIERQLEERYNEIIEKYDAKIYDTGWQNIQFMNGTQEDTDLGPSAYRVKNGVCHVIFNIKLTTNTIPSTGLIFFKLPTKYSPAYPFSFLSRTNGTAGKNPVKCSYDFTKQEFKIWQNNDNSLKSGDYVYGEVTFLVEDDV
ncbi:BppU family phage baseplate upper protein [Staphylococcus felis]|uniref:BppU family phage baseplate upper protein n=1 Tax=Staphylococcus felis TaxID=46127 RepID=UPI003F43CA54